MSYTVYVYMELLVKLESLTLCVYIYGPTFDNAESCLYLLHNVSTLNAESYPVTQLCVNSLLATKVTLIVDGIKFGRLRVKI
jgi:hypothetical protein